MLQLTLLSLATWRLTALLVYEAGPRGIFAYLRKVSDAIGGPLECFWCTSVWVGLLASSFLPLWGRVYPHGVVWWLAISAVAIMIDEIRQNYFPQLGCDEEDDDVRDEEAG